MKIFNIEIVYIIFYIFVEKSIATLTHKIQTYINIKMSFIKLPTKDFFIKI